MKIAYKLEALKRKTLVKALALHTGLKPEYLGVPSLAYRLGDWTVDKANTLTGPDDRDLIATLRDQHSFVPESEEYDAPVEAQAPAADEAPQAEPAAEPEEAPEFPTAPELDRVIIEYPLTGFTPQALDNLCKMVRRKRN